MGKLRMTAAIIALSAVMLGGCVAYPHHGYGRPYGYQSRPYYPGGYPHYRNNWGHGGYGYGYDGHHHGGHHHGGRHDDD